MTTVTGEVVATDDTPEVTPEGLSFSETATSYALADLFASAMTDYVKKHRRPEMFDALMEAFREGHKTSNVRMDGETVATATVTEPQGKVTVTDTEAFTAWVETHFPTETTPVFKVEVNSAFQKQLLESYTEPADKKKEGEVYVKETSKTADVVGQSVPGLTYTPPGDPTSFSLRWKNKEAKAAAMEKVMEAVAPHLAPILASSPDTLTGELTR